MKNAAMRGDFELVVGAHEQGRADEGGVVGRAPCAATDERCESPTMIGGGERSRAHVVLKYVMFCPAGHAVDVTFMPAAEADEQGILYLRHKVPTPQFDDVGGEASGAGLLTFLAWSACTAARAPALGAT